MYYIEKKFIHKSYITIKTFSTTQRVKFIKQKKFAKKILDDKFKTFVVYVATIKSLKPAEKMIYLFQAAPIVVL